jgi:hypothetical protein
MRVKALLAAALVVAGAPLAMAADPAGHYAVEGKNPGDGSSYSGTVDVTRTGDTFKVVWSVAGDTYVGTAIGNEDFLAVSYKSGKDTGLALYGAQAGNWIGPWAYAGGTELGAERWTRR